MILLQAGISRIELWQVMFGVLLLACVIFFVIPKLEVTREKKKYPALRSIASSMEFCSWIILIGSFGIVFYMVSQAHDQNYLQKYWQLPAIIIASGMITFLFLLAQAELIRVFIDIEENTRKGIKNLEEKQA